MIIEEGEKKSPTTEENPDQILKNKKRGKDKELERKKEGPGTSCKAHVEIR